MIGTLTRLPSGLFIDGWRVLKELGNGGFAVVYLVEKNGQRRALKVARHRQASGDDKQTHARVMRELTVLLMLMEQGGHPNIVKTHGHGYAETGNLYLVLDYVDGWTLDEWKEKKHPTFREILRVIAKVAAALASLHGLGILHRDLKLSNVIFRKSDGEPIIIDFSCATYAQARALTESGLPPGTDCFRAPQQFEHLRQYKEEHRARYAFQVADEIFAVGAMLYELLTDPRPTEVRPRETLNNPVAMPTPARKRNPRVPEALSDLTDDMLARDAAKRPVDFGAVGREVAELLADPIADYDALAHPPSEQRQPTQPEGGEPVVLEPANKRRWPALRALHGRVVARAGGPGKVLAAGSVAAVVLAAVVALWLSSRVAPLPPAAPQAATAPDMSSPAPEPVVGTGPASVPVQKEGSTVKPPPPESPQQVRTQRGQKTPLTPDVKKALALGCALASGCTGPWVRPEPFKCPAGAIATRKQLRWGESERFIVTVDDRHEYDTDIWLSAGDTVVGVVPEGVTPQLEKAPPGTRFFGGKVYVVPEKTQLGEPGRVFVKYERVKLPRQEELPVCFIIETGAEELKDGAAKLPNEQMGKAVDYWP
ncbi:MAG TPA: serine/threonine-protein kinase [Myxococcaceae bacterium]